MSNRKKLRQPQHVHAFDQAMGHATELSKEPGAAAVVLDYAATSRRCTWCDCPPGAGSPHQDPDYSCSGCPLEAVFDLHFLVGTPQYAVYPVCRPHLRGLQEYLASSGVPVSVEQYPA